MKSVLLTGAVGMIGSEVVRGMLSRGYRVIGLDRRESSVCEEGYTHAVVDLCDAAAIARVMDEYAVDRVIHLAALAHTAGESDLSYDTYYRINVLCSQNIFSVAAARGIPVLFISTADVYGFVKGVATRDTVPKPVTVYGKTKYLAEQSCAELCKQTGYDIFRLAPVYTPQVKRDIQKRYYLKYPKLAYMIGKGMEYEFLSIDRAVERMVGWMSEEPTNGIFNVKDDALVSTADCLRREREEGRAKHVLRFPKWMIAAGFWLVKLVTGKNKYTYLLNKAVHPIRTR